MSEPAVFALIRNHEARYFADRWANALLRRELMWGPDDFEAWVLQFDSLEEWDSECDCGAVVDFDRRILAWCSDTSAYRVPRVLAVHQAMLAAAWTGFDVKYVVSGNDTLAKYARDATGEAEPSALVVSNPQKEDEDCINRFDTVEEAARDAAQEDDDEQKRVNEIRAWVTIVDADGKIQHVELQQLPKDVLNGEPEALAALARLRPSAVPREAIVSEGLCIDFLKRSAGFWGSPELAATVNRTSAQWANWQLTWLNRGYAEQCAIAGETGEPMSDTEAVAKVVPLILSMQQFDAEMMLGAIGSGLRRFTNKLVGCLLVVLCLPLVILGLVSNNWQPVLISIVATTLIVIGVYQYFIYRFKRMMRRGLSEANREQPKSVVAGPQDETTRRERIDELLRQSGLPRLSEAEPLFSDKTGLELLTDL